MNRFLEISSLQWWFWNLLGVVVSVSGCGFCRLGVEGMEGISRGPGKYL